MSIQVKFRRGTATQHNSFTGANGEITVDTTNKTLRVHDGVTVGGIRLARYSELGSGPGANVSAYLQVANANAKFATKAYAASNTAVRSLISDRLQVANAAASFKIIAEARAELANTNAYIATKANWTSLTGTNTALRTLITDRLQVANATALYATKAYAASNTYLNSNFLNKTLNGTSSQTVQSNIRFSANVSIQGKLFVTGGVTTYSANNLSIGDNMIYLNSGSVASNPDLGFAGNYNDGTYHHTGFFRDASDAGTWKVFENYLPEPDANVYINTSHASFKLAPFSAQNITTTRNLIVGANSTLGNTSVTGFLKLNGTDIRATFAQNTYVKTTLANTNLYIASKANWSALTGTNTALRSLISDRLQVANARSYMQVANVKSYLANTNSYIATKVNTSTFNAALANTNAYINTVVVSGGATWSGLTSTNTALRTLISDRYQVANVNSLLANKATWTALTGTNTALRTIISDRLQVANAVATYATKSNPTTSGLIQHTGRMTISTNLDVSGNTQIYKLIANGSLGTAGYALKTNGTSVYWDAVGAAGTGTGATWSALTGTNTALRVLISDRMQVANVKSYLANTNAYIATKVNTSTFNAALANTNAYIASVITSGGAVPWIALTSTNTALRTLISDRMQVANTNTLINGRATWTALTGTNTALRTLISDRYQVANVNSNFLKKTGTAPQTITPNVNFSANVSITGRLTVTGGITSYFANNVSTGDNMIYLNANSTVSNPDLGFAGNYNDGSYHHAGFFRDASDAGTFKVFENYGLEPDASPYIDTTHATFKLAPFSAQNIRVARNLTVIANSSLGNTSVTGFLKLGATDIRATFAQNTYVKTTLANTNLRVDRINTNLTGTNTALRTLISDRLQTSNASSTYQTKTIERAALANTNSYIATKASWTALTGTNTAIRTLVSDRYQVANVNTLLAAKATWVALTSTNTAIRALIGSGGSSNSFSRVVVGANTAIAASSVDVLTLVAGSGMTISANPATDTITFTSTGGSGTFSGGTVSGATTFTNSTASGNNATGAVKITGGLGVTGNMYTAGRVGFANTASVGVAYTYYNNTTKSLDTVFGI